MTVCEMLHCSYSELSSRCPSMADIPLILKYIKEKGEREEYAGKLPLPKQNSKVRTR